MTYSLEPLELDLHVHVMGGIPLDANYIICPNCGHHGAQVPFNEICEECYIAITAWAEEDEPDQEN